MPHFAGFAVVLGLTAASLVATPPAPAAGQVGGGSAGTISGSVVDEDTQLPVARATVQLVGDREVRGTLADADGGFQFEDVPEGTYRVRASHPGYREAESAELVVSAGTAPEVELRLPPDPVVLDSILVSVERSERPLRVEEQLVAGRLLDDETGEPVETATVRLVNHLGSSVATVPTDAEGRFRLVSPRPGPYRVTAERMGYRPAESAEFHLMPGDSVGVEFRLSTDAVLVEPLTVTASARPWGARADLRSMGEFFDRWARYGQSGLGEFMTRDEIAEFEGRAITANHMLATTTTAVSHVDAGGNAMLRTLQRCPSVRYWLDGMQVPNPPNLAPHDLEAVEVYLRPNIPPELNLDEFPCGVIAYWTRRSPDLDAPSSSRWRWVAAGVAGALGLMLVR